MRSCMRLAQFLLIRLTTHYRLHRAQNADVERIHGHLVPYTFRRS